jgi:hypothetical protein
VPWQRGDEIGDLAGEALTLRIIGAGGGEAEVGQLVQNILPLTLSIKSINPIITANSQFISK